MDAQLDSSPPTVRAGGPKVYVMISRATLALIGLQFGFAGLGAFAALGGGDVKDTWWAPHSMVGYLIALLLVVLAVLAPVQRLAPSAVRWTAVAAGLAVVGQPLLAVLGTHAGAWFGFLHALDGVVIAAVLGIVSARVSRAGAPAA